MLMLLQAAQSQNGESNVAFYGFVVVMLVVVGFLFKAAVTSKDED